MHDGFWQWLLGEKGQIALAGALGGVVRWLSLREDWKSGIVSITVGAICAVYLAPLAIPSFEPLIGKLVVDHVSRAGFSGFLIGIGGIAVSGFVIDLWRARARQVQRDNEGGGK